MVLTYTEEQPANPNLAMDFSQVGIQEVKQPNLLINQSELVVSSSAGYHLVRSGH